ncbi:MAG: hypothetical protein R3E76_12150 [Planctomycetota bacterium]
MRKLAVLMALVALPIAGCASSQSSDTSSTTDFVSSGSDSSSDDGRVLIQGQLISLGSSANLADDVTLEGVELESARNSESAELLSRPTMRIKLGQSGRIEFDQSANNTHVTGYRMSVLVDANDAKLDVDVMSGQEVLSTRRVDVTKYSESGLDFGILLPTDQGDQQMLMVMNLNVSK